MQGAVGMKTAHRFEDLVCWQLSVDLRDRVLVLIEQPTIMRDVDFHGQTRAAVTSPARNISEGFRRFKPRQFAYLTRVALASLAETRNQLLDGVNRGYWTIHQVRDLLHLEFRATKATTGLLQYLDSCQGEAPTGWDHERPAPDAAPAEVEPR